MSHVVLDLPPETLAKIAAAAPAALLALSTVVAPLIGSILPQDLKRAWSEPSDGSTAPPGAKDYSDDAYRSKDSSTRVAVRTWKSWTLSILAGAEAVVWTVAAFIVLVRAYPWMNVIEAASIAASWLFVALSPTLRPPASAPALLFVFYLLQVVLLVLHAISFSLHSSRLSQDSFAFVLGFTGVHALVLTTTLAVIVSYPMTPQKTDKPADKDLIVHSKNEIHLESPEETVTLAAWIVFSWVGPLIQKASKARLNYADVWSLPSNMASEGVRRSAARLRSNRVITRVICNNSLDLTVSLTLGFVSAGVSYLAPYFLKQILTALTPPEPGEIADPNLRKSAYVYAVLAFASQVARAEIDLQQLWHERRMIIRTQTALTGEVYAKALKRRDLSGVIAPKETAANTPTRKKKGDKSKATPPAGVSSGKIVNLMAVDVKKISNQLMSLSSTATAPVELVACTFFLYNLLGWTAIAGLSVMVVTLPVNQFLVKRRIRIHREVLASRDYRQEVLGEFIQAIRFVKISALEEKWLGRVYEARDNELSWLMKTRMNYLGINVVWNLTPDLILLIAFACFTKIRGEELTVPTAFTALALFALLRGPMGSLPSSITSLLQTWVSIQRLEAFFDEPEVEPWVSTLRDDFEPSPTTSMVSIVNGHFRYQDMTTAPDAVTATAAKSPAASECVADFATSQVADDSNSVFELRDINVAFPTGEMSLIAGPTGAGKTSLLLALLGEIDRISGEVKIAKTVAGMGLDNETGLYDGLAYASQIPWLQHDSIKNNILFGAPFEKGRYDEVIKECALGTDLELFDAGDETEIGEKGISLSGGQKARVALARAVYSRAKTVLLDDPLSAVDSHTGRHLYEKCLKGPLLKNRTIILVTHHIELCMPGSSYIVRMDTGRIESASAVEDLDREEIAQELEVEKEAEEEAAVEANPGDVETTAQLVLKPDAERSSTGPTRVPSPTAVEAVTKGKLVQEEARAEGRVKGSVYRLYLRSAGWWTWVAIVGLILLGRWARVADRYWLKWWGESYNTAHSSFSLLYLPQQALFTQHENDNLETSALLPHLPSARENVNPYLVIYGLICLANLAILVGSVLFGFRGSFRAARKLFKQTLTRVTAAPFRYFDTTPTGRILNRFSTDFQIIDQSLTDQVRICLGHAFSFAVNVGVIVLVSPRFILPAVFIVYCYVRLSLSYVKSSRDLRRLESNARSPIFSKFGETLHGIVTARAFGAERRFLQGLFKSVDYMLAVNYASAVVNRYLLWRFDCLGAIAVAITTFLSLAAGASPGLTALAITSAQSLVQSVYWLARFISALEVDLNAVERVTELLDVPQEPPSIIESSRPPAYWPSDTGGISVENLVMAYAPSLPPVLKDISFEIAPREKVGVVGRTGSGKSTIAMSLLRFADPISGRIVIDGIDINKIGLHDLRSRITLIPQEAVLFSGTIRSNLDPFDQLTDQECLDALARVRMIAAPVPAPSARESRDASREHSRAPSPTPQPGPEAGAVANAATAGPNARLVANARAASITSSSESTRVESSTGRINVTLDTPVSAGGHNFSAGQRQLLALARALLRRAKVIIMDESTASVDLDSDARIQRTVQEEFADSLVITIAHRLLTIIDYDKVLVLDQGNIVEYDSPRALLLKEGGAFRAMCEKSADWDELKHRIGL